MEPTRTTTEDPGARVRQLLLSGDNIIKNRDNAERFERARERYVTARALAVEAGLDVSIVEIIDRRLSNLTTDHPA